MRQNLNLELIAMFQRFFRRPAQANAGRRASNDNSSCRKSGTLRQKTNELGNTEDEVTLTVLGEL